MAPLKGHCHCGQTQWEVELPEQNTVLCHCDTCKYLSGSGYTLNQIIPKDNFKLTKGSLQEYQYKGDSGKAVHCYYCPNCTTHPYHHQDALGDQIVVRTVLLEGGKDLKPALEIYGNARIPWIPEAAKTLPGGP